MEELEGHRIETWRGTTKLEFPPAIIVLQTSSFIEKD